MRGVSTDFSGYSAHFLDVLATSILEVLNETGLGKAGDIRVSTLLKELGREAAKKQQEELKEADVIHILHVNGKAYGFYPNEDALKRAAAELPDSFDISITYRKR